MSKINRNVPVEQWIAIAKECRNIEKSLSAISTMMCCVSPKHDRAYKLIRVVTDKTLHMKCSLESYMYSNCGIRDSSIFWGDYEVKQ